MDGFAPGALWPADDPESEQIREVYSRYGLAMYMVQVLEHGMVNASIVMRTLPSMAQHADKESWQKTFDGAYEGGLARTYGNMVRELERLDGFPALLLARLRAAKEDRDVLTHRFFRQNDLAFMNPAGRTHMIAWCEERIRMFQALSDELEAFLEPIRTEHGVTPEWVERQFGAMQDDARNWSSDGPPRP